MKLSDIIKAAGNIPPVQPKPKPTIRQAVSEALERWEREYKTKITPEQMEVLLPPLCSERIASMKLHGLHLFELLHRNNLKHDFSEYFDNPGDICRVLHEIGVISENEFVTYTTAILGVDFFYFLAGAVNRAK